MPAVTIESVDAFQLRIPHDMWAEPPLFAGRPRTHVEAVYVRVATDRGVTGWGECSGFSGAGVIMHAIGGLDIALWGMRGKLEGVSVSKLLGGAKRKRVETYASLI